jgi:hypothetical protein
MAVRKIKDHMELAEINRLRQGYVFNDRADRKKLHAAGCEALQAMVSSAYDKWFFDDFDEAKEWLNARYGRGKWEGCGRCL